jgi:hypothetical protein
MQTSACFLRVLALLLLCTAHDAFYSMGDNPMMLNKVSEALADETGAACLDGSLPAFYYRKGTSKRFVVMLEGGGWCGAAAGRSFAMCDEVSGLR